MHLFGLLNGKEKMSFFNFEALLLNVKTFSCKK